MEKITFDNNLPAFATVGYYLQHYDKYNPEKEAWSEEDLDDYDDYNISDDPAERITDDIIYIPEHFDYDEEDYEEFDNEGNLIEDTGDFIGYGFKGSYISGKLTINKSQVAALFENYYYIVNGGAVKATVSDTQKIDDTDLENKFGEPSRIIYSDSAVYVTADRIHKVYC